VPLLKLIGLAIMLLGIHRGSETGLIGKTRLYRVVEAIGRWSMIDIFVVSVLIALVRFGSVASINAGLGAAFFAGVVVLTILAAEAFDPRLMWDAAEERRR
jgi:paraquat-inducible protein A